MITTITVSAVSIIVIVAGAWVLFIRPWMRKQTEGWPKRIMDRIEAWEITLYRKSEQIAWARFKIVIGALVTLLTSIQAIDVTPYLYYIPEKYRLAVYVAPLVAGLLAGFIGEMMRRDTKTPLEIVALPNDVSPVVQHAVTEAAAANALAVAVVETEKTAATLAETPKS